MRSPPLPTHRQAQVTIPRPRRNGKLMPFNFCSEILHYLNPINTPSRQPLPFALQPEQPSPPTLSSAAPPAPLTQQVPSTPPCPAQPKAFSPRNTPPPPQLAPQALFPPLPPLPNIQLTDQQANNLADGHCRESLKPVTGCSFRFTF